METFAWFLYKGKHFYNIVAHKVSNSQIFLLHRIRFLDRMCLLNLVFCFKFSYEVHRYPSICLLPKEDDGHKDDSGVCGDV